MNDFLPRQCWRRTRGRFRTNVGLSGTGAEGAWLARVRVFGQGYKGIVTDASGGGKSGRGGRGRDSTVVTGPRLLVTLLCARCNRRCDYLLVLALVLSTRVTVAVAFFFIFLVVGM